MQKRELTLDELIHLLHRLVEQAGSQKTFAEWHGISPAYLNDVLHGRREPGEMILRAIGYERRVTYVKRSH